MSLAHVVEKDGILVVTQSNEPALQNFWNTGIALLWGVPSIVLYYWFHLQVSGSVGPAAIPLPVLIFFFGLPFLVMLFQSVNRLFGKEAFVFDRNKGVFNRNGFTVGPLREIRAVTAQVTGNGQYPMFRLILELPRCKTVVIVRTHEIPAEGEFHLSGNFFSNPNKRFAVFEPWMDYDEQNLIPFLPPEIVELRKKILEYID